MYRPEEGHVLINARPGYNNRHAIAGVVNEPLKDERANLHMVSSYAKILEDSDPHLVAYQLQQPPGAATAWRAHILPPVCSTADAKRAAARVQRKDGALRVQETALPAQRATDCRL